MYSVLFVCLGNICRSPMAEMIFKNLAKKNHMEYAFFCESRGISTEEYGKPIYPKTIQKLNEHLIPVESHIVSVVKKEDYHKYNYIICMDKENYMDLMQIFQGDPSHKVHLLSEFFGSNNDILDPWYTGDFETAYNQIEEGCTSLFDSLVLKYYSEMLFA